MMDADATRHGAVETPEEDRKFARTLAVSDLTGRN
jgi:hypothetical protein